VPAVREQFGEVAGVRVRWLAADGDDPPVLYVHGVPTNADLWRGFLERTGGIAVDLPGFGRSDKPTDFDYSIAGYDAFLEAFLAELGVQRLRLAVHDWGAVGLAFAQRFPERIDRLAVVDSVPLLPGYRWHRIARLWRTRLVGELTMGFTGRRTMHFVLREAFAGGGPPDEFTELVWSAFDQGTQRAILRLYRGADPATLAAAGAHLDRIRCPAMVFWGGRDPYVPARFAAAYADAIGAPEPEIEPEAGHWPWLDRAGLHQRICAFLAPDAARRRPV
jgi:pimeloyl-ACP methyl ester carboxylesterase